MDCKVYFTSSDLNVETIVFRDSILLCRNIYRFAGS